MKDVWTRRAKEKKTILKRKNVCVMNDHKLDNVERALRELREKKLSSYYKKVCYLRCMKELQQSYETY